MIVINLLTQHIPVICLLIVRTSNFGVLTVWDELAQGEVYLPISRQAGFDISETHQLGDVRGQEWQSNEHLMSHDDEDARQQTVCAIVILDQRQNAWQHKDGSSLYRHTHRE